MARFNEILAGRYNKHLTRLFSIKGSAPSAQLSSEIQPGIQMFNGAENRFLESWNRFGAGATVTGAAANQAAWQIRNPGPIAPSVSSGAIVVIERLSISSSVNDPPLVSLGTNQNDFPIGLGIRAFDNRGVGGGASNISLGTQTRCSSTVNTPSVQAGPIMNPFLLANVEYNIITTDNQEIPLPPGDSLIIIQTTVASILRVSVWWRERQLEESESRQ